MVLQLKSTSAFTGGQQTVCVLYMPSEQLCIHWYWHNIPYPELQFTL